jgi:hypothetical protein
MLVKKAGVCHQYALMILRSARQYRGDESYSKTSSLIAEEIGKAGSLVVLVAWQIGIRKLAYGYEQRGDSQPLQRSRQSFMAVVGGQRIAGEKPHGQPENKKSKTDQTFHAKFRKNSYHHGREKYDYKCAGSKDQPRIRCRIAVEPLHHLRNKYGGSIQRKSEHEVENIG